MPSWFFLFSNQRRYRLARHISFWTAWVLFQWLLYSFTPSPVLKSQSFWMRLYLVMPEIGVFLLPQLFLAYGLMYIVVTRLVLPGKYVVAVGVSVLFLLLTALMAAGLSLTLVDLLRQKMTASVSPVVASQPKTPVVISLGVAMLAGLRGAITVGGVAAAIKLMKCLYEKQQAALLLEKEKVQAEMNLLRAQLHPHFLFNTLNNIHSLTQDASPVASAMIMRLSGLLRYMLYDGGKAALPLQQELAMINDYIQLEAMRYDQSLDLSIDFPARTDIGISPLLLLPFVENAFKHGASRMIEKPWISLRVALDGKRLTMVLANGRDLTETSQQHGIGIANVRKRLDLLYPYKHELQLKAEEELFYVHLTIDL